MHFRNIVQLLKGCYRCNLDSVPLAMDILYLLHFCRLKLIRMSVGSM